MSTLNEASALELRDLLERHNESEKHIGYHILPECFDTLVTAPEKKNKYRFFERERFEFFSGNVDFSGKKVLDIGCNIGYFLFSFLQNGAAHATGYEGKRSCGEFVTRAIEVANLQERFDFHNEYVEFDAFDETFDVALLLNVLHHLGDDYGDQGLNIERAKQLMMDQLNKLSAHTSVLIFQLGFNWKGNRHVGLFANGTKREMIDYVRAGTAAHWDIVKIGVPQREDGKVSYRELSNDNIERDDALGEFLNRPIFILRSKKAG